MHAPHHSLTIRHAGDANQLPPVGPGTVLEAALQSCVVPVIDLQQIFRQECNSAIVACAHAVNAGQFPDFARDQIPAHQVSVCGLTAQKERAQDHASVSTLVAGQYPKFMWDQMACRMSWWSCNSPLSACCEVRLYRPKQDDPGCHWWAAGECSWQNMGASRPGCPA